MGYLLGMDTSTTQTAAAKNTVISARIALHLAAGKPLPEAVDAVLGAGAYLAMVGQIYDALRARAA